MKAKVLLFFKKAGWRGALLGIVASAVLSPFLSLIFTPLFVAGGIPSFQKPVVEASVHQTEDNYDSGVVLERYGNVTWKEDYGIYRVFLRNEDGPDMENVRMHLRFPGCAIGYKPSGIGIRGDFELDAPLEAEVSGTNSEVLNEIDGASCTIYIETDELAEDETIMTEFIVDHQPERCDILLSYNPNPKFIVEYSWTAHGHRFEPNYAGSIEGAEEEFGGTTEIIENSTTVYTSESEVYDEPHKALIYGVKLSNAEAAADKCYG